LTTIFHKIQLITCEHFVFCIKENNRWKSYNWIVSYTVCIRTFETY